VSVKITAVSQSRQSKPHDSSGFTQGAQFFLFVYFVHIPFSTLNSLSSLWPGLVDWKVRHHPFTFKRRMRATSLRWMNRVLIQSLARMPGDWRLSEITGLMRKDSRNIAGALLIVLMATLAAEGQPSSPAQGSDRGHGDLVTLTVQVTWDHNLDGGTSVQGNSVNGPETTLKLTEGQIGKVVAVPEAGEFALDALSDKGVGILRSDGAWVLGMAKRGRIRASLRCPVGAGLEVRSGDEVVRIPIVAILEKPQRTPSSLPLRVSVERLAWDSLTVEFAGAANRGILAPGSTVRLLVGLNVIWPEKVGMSARLSGVIRPVRGGEEVWREDRREQVESNGESPRTWEWVVPVPKEEGTYEIELKAVWEPGVREGSRLGRLIRRRRAPAATSAVRRVTFVVLDSRARGMKAAGSRPIRDTEVDLVDFARGRGHRPVASGRSALDPVRSAWPVPVEALIEPSRRDRLRGWILGWGSEKARLEAADPKGLAWMAFGLRVVHPERPHRLTISVRGGEPAALGVAVVEPGSPRMRPRMVLDACASGPPLLEGGPPAIFRWLIWPTTSEQVLVLVNRGRDAPVQLGAIQLTEVGELPPIQPLEPSRPERAMGLYLAGQRSLEPFLGRDLIATAHNVADYLGVCGLRTVVLDERLGDGVSRRVLGGQFEEDCLRADPLDVLVRVLRRRGVDYWLELELGGAGGLPGLPPADSESALLRGLVRIDARGRSEGVYHPLNPEVQAAFKARLKSVLEASSRPAASGIVIRLGSGAALLGMPDTGFDDGSYGRFVAETYEGETAQRIPGLGTTSADRLEQRAKYLAGAGRTPWLSWRSRAIAALYAELAATVRAASPGAELAVATPDLDGGLAGEEARRIDRAGLSSSQVWRELGLDLQVWPRSPDAPIVLRGISLSSEPLARDLASSPELNSLVAGLDSRGLLLLAASDSFGPGAATAASDPVRVQAGSPEWESSSERLAPESRLLELQALPMNDSTADPPLIHALAAIDPRSIFLGAEVVAGREEQVRRQAQIVRSLPIGSPQPQPDDADSAARSYGIATRILEDGVQTYFEITNESPFLVRLAGRIEGSGSSVVDDLGRGLRLAPRIDGDGRQLVLDLPPNDLTAIRVGAAHARLVQLTPYPSPAVMADMKARFNELSNQLARLNRGASPLDLTPANPGFEPLPAPSAQGSDAVPRQPLAGWSAVGPGSAAIALDGDEHHSGQTSLRFAVTEAPASLISDPLSSRVQSSLSIVAYVRGDGENQKLGVWIEGQAGDRPFNRHSELSLSKAWSRLAVRATDLPVDGVEGVRIRFELERPGVFWIDDLTIEGEPAPRGGRQSAQRALLAALQAYRESRYADFTRLADSHWIRESSTSLPRIARSEALWNRPASSVPSPLPRERTVR